MDQQPLYIQSWSQLSNDGLIVDGKIVFENSENLPQTDWINHLYRCIGFTYPKFHKMDLLCKSAMLVTESLSDKDAFDDKGMPLVFANRGGSMVSDEKHASSIFLEKEGFASPAVFVYTLANIAMGEISIRHGLQSPNVFFIFDRFDDRNTVDFLIQCQTQLFYSSDTERLLGGWLEVSETHLDVFLYTLGGEGLHTFTGTDLLTLYKGIS